MGQGLILSGVWIKVSALNVDALFLTLTLTLKVDTLFLTLTLTLNVDALFLTLTLTLTLFQERFLGCWAPTELGRAP